MTDVAIPETTHAPAVQQGYSPMPSAPSPLMLWALEARQAGQIANSLAKTSFVPQSLRNKPADVTAAILAGQELGLQPMASLRSMDVIQGTPALRAHAQRGLVQSHGHKVWIEPGASREKVVMKGQRREADGTYGEVQESVWDIPRAAEMGLTGKSEWKKQPQTMLTARATGEICRLVAADVLYAMPYNSEELSDGNAEPTPFRTTVRVDTAEILANAEAAKRAARPVSGPPAELRHEQPDLGEDENAWDDVQAAQPADANGGPA